MKPCPFCGGKAVYPFRNGSGGHALQCFDCRSMSGHMASPEVAIAAWNRRPERTCKKCEWAESDCVCRPPKPCGSCERMKAALEKIGCKYKKTCSEVASDPDYAGMTPCWRCAALLPPPDDGKKACQEQECPGYGTTACAPDDEPAESRGEEKPKQCRQGWPECKRTDDHHYTDCGEKPAPAEKPCCFCVMAKHWPQSGGPAMCACACHVSKPAASQEEK